MTVYRFSKPAPSATRPSLHRLKTALILGGGQRGIFCRIVTGRQAHLHKLRHEYSDPPVVGHHASRHFSGQSNPRGGLGLQQGMGRLGGVFLSFPQYLRQPLLADPGFHLRPGQLIFEAGIANRARPELPVVQGVYWTNNLVMQTLNGMNLQSPACAIFSCHNDINLKLFICGLI